MAESAPLLHDIASNDDLGLAYRGEPAMRNHFASTAKVLRVVTLVLSVIMLGLLITNIILLDSGNFLYSWGARHATSSFLKWVRLLFQLVDSSNTNNAHRSSDR